MALHSVALHAQPSSGTWTGPGLSSSGVLDPLQSGNGTHKERYTLTTPEGCVWKDSINVTVDVLPEPVMQYNGDPICGDDVVTLTVDNVAWPTIIQWYRDGSQIWGANTTTYSTRVGGNYMVRVTKGTCSFDTQPADVKQEDDNIWFDIPLICSDAEIDLTVSPLGGTWSGPAVTTAGRLNPALLDNGLYAEVYRLVTPIGCTWQKTAYVAVDKLLHPTLSTNMETVCRDVSATLTLGSIADWSTIAWQSDKDLDLPDNHQSIETDVPATYWATVSKSYCTLSTEQITLVATPHNLFVPNVFTANGDGANEYFQVSGEGLDSFQMSVYNRYGQLVYETDDFYFRWAGENVSPGIYFWRATYRSCADTREALNGWVQFIR